MIKEPALDCLQDVYIYLEGLAEEIATRIFTRFPGLVGEILEIVSKVLAEERDATKEILEDIIDSEQGYLFTNDYDYLTNRTDIVTDKKRPEDRQRLSSQSIFVLELRQRIDQYFGLVIRNVRDRVPKTIGYFLVHNCQNKVQFHLYNEINSNKELANALGEHPTIAEERIKLKKRLEILTRSSKVLLRDPDITNVLQLDEEVH